MIFFFPNFSTMKNTRQRKGCKKTIARLPNTRNQHSWPVLIIPPARYVYSHRRTRDHANASRVILIPEHRWQAVQCVSGRCFVSSLCPPSSWSLARIRITNSPSEKNVPEKFSFNRFPFRRRNERSPRKEEKFHSIEKLWKILKEISSIEDLSSISGEISDEEEIRFDSPRLEISKLNKSRSSSWRGIKLSQDWFVQGLSKIESEDRHEEDQLGGE